jgi:hypothetical protein
MALILIKINYSPGYSPRVREIVVGVDASLEEYRGYLGQRDIKTRRVRLIRYKSGT